MKKLMIASLFCFVCSSCSLFEKHRMSPKIQTYEEFQEACNKLNKNHPNGYKYKPFVGRFLGSKSYHTTGVDYIHKSPDAHWYHMSVWEEYEDEKEVLIYIPFLAEQHEQYYRKFTRVVDREYVHNRKNSKNYYGLCTYRPNAPLGVLSTLTKIRSGHD